MTGAVYSENSRAKTRMFSEVKDNIVAIMLLKTGKVKTARMHAYIVFFHLDVRTFLFAQI